MRYVILGSNLLYNAPSIAAKVPGQVQLGSKFELFPFDKSVSSYPQEKKILEFTLSDCTRHHN